MKTIWKWIKIVLLVTVSFYVGYTWCELDYEDCYEQVEYNWTLEEAEI